MILRVGLIFLLTFVASTPCFSQTELFVRGDVNGSGSVETLTDVIFLLNFGFQGGAAPGCDRAADINDDGSVSVLTDALYLLAAAFTGGPPIPEPSICGTDPTPDGLSCEMPPACPAHPGLTFAGTNAQGHDEYTLDLDPTVVLILIPGGTFEMGQTAAAGATPVHEVTLSPYFISKYEITTSQYRLYCDATLTPYPPPPSFGGMPADHFTNPLYDDHPVVMVSWNDLNAPGGYLEWAGLVLPTEAQWEFAARGTPGGDLGRTYPWGDDLPDAGGVFRTNYCPAGFPNCGTDGWQFTAPVAQGPFDQYPGPFGTLGQAGNVWEWCQDWFGAYPATPQVDPTGPASGSFRVDRGGGWGNVAFHLQSAVRNYFDPSNRFEGVGFRPARVIP